MANFTRLHHVTPYVNLASIVEKDLLPSFARGKRKVVWLCALRNLMWAVSHTSVNHAVSADLLSVVDVEVDFDRLKMTRWQGIYTAEFPVEVVTIWTAADAINRYAISERLPKLGE
jgi:hypothetical protein